MLPAGDQDKVEHAPPDPVELIEILIKLILLHLVSCLYYRINDARSHEHKKVLLNSQRFAAVVSEINRN